MSLRHGSSYYVPTRFPSAFLNAFPVAMSSVTFPVPVLDLFLFHLMRFLMYSLFVPNFASRRVHKLLACVAGVNAEW